MAPPYTGPKKIQIYTWQSGATHYACQHGWHHPGVQLPVMGGSSEGVVENLQAALWRDIRIYVEQEWPYYVEELLGSTSMTVTHLSEPCTVHPQSPLPTGNATLGDSADSPVLGPARGGRLPVEPKHPGSDLNPSPKRVPLPPSPGVVGVEAKVAHHIQELLRLYDTDDEELALRLYREECRQAERMSLLREGTTILP